MKKKILVVDDKETIAKIILSYLGDKFDIVWFNNPLKALEWLAEVKTADLIISDLRMPEMRGDAFLSHLKTNEAYRDIPVIILSGEDSTSERIRLLEAGAEDYIVKPFNPVELNLRVKRIIKE